ncbi:MAG TPA: ABC transporter ATP-binding protein [Aggregatilineales bacterium]|nr:ABC transporter ATP-binding protein [Aggregatilineales bacterium]
MALATINTPNISSALMDSPALIVAQLHKTFGSQPALRGVSLTVYAGEIMALLGASGCGKTTLLRVIAGFEQPDTPQGGTISIGGRVVAGDGVQTPPELRRVGMVFQDYALFPHLNVAENIAFGVKGNATAKASRTTELLDLVGLEGFRQRMPHELSGGQQQRVALARALAPQPDMLLLDEPFSNLDAALRGMMRVEIRAILRRVGITGVFVTHDQEEALSLADRVAVMAEGHIVQCDTPEVIYNAPINRKVASFIGEASFLAGIGRGETVRCALGDLPLDEPRTGAVAVMIRPEMVRLTPAAEWADGDTSGEGRVLWREYYGRDQRVGVALGESVIIARVEASPPYAAGMGVRVAVRGKVRAFAGG